MGTTNSTAGLKVPGDSKVEPCGERMGPREARVQGLKGRSAVRAAKESNATRRNIVRSNFDFINCAPGRRVDGHIKMGGELVCRYELTQRTRRTQSSQRREERV